MSATKFIDELQRRRLLTDPQIAELRDSLAARQHPHSAQAVADFLVLRKQLSEDQALVVLHGLSQSGIDLNAEDGIAPRREFYSPEIDDEDEIRLMPLDDDFGTADQTGAADDDLPILGAVAPVDEPLSGWTTAPQISELPEPELETEEVHIVDRRPVARIEEETAKEAPPRPNRTTALRRSAKDIAKEKAKAAKARKRWDSPLILAGGGGLVFLVLLGGTLWWLLGRESGDQVLAHADQALKSGQYVLAIDQYAHFLKDFPRHPEHSRARVQLAMVRIRQPTESKDFAAAVLSAESELKAIEDEEAFKEPDVHGELAALLPQIAQGLADQADKANPTSDDAKKFSELAGQAIALYNNGAYVPKSLRDEAKLANVQDTLDHAARRKLSQLALGEGLKAMQQAIADGKPIAAYTTHRKLLREHPELTGEPSLAEAVQKATAAEQAAVRYVKENKAAETSERQAPWRAALTVANRRLKPATPAAAAGATACIRISGAVYSMDVASGGLLWRRHVGFGPSAPPMLIGPDVLIADPAHNELLRLEAATGKLVWRQTIGEPFAGLLVAGNVVLIPSESGRLCTVDLKTGERTGYLQFGQPLRVAPAIDRQKTRIYFPGDEACLYTVSLADMKCIGVRYLGHAPGSIRVSIAPVMDKVALVENEGVETSRLRLMSLDEKGAIGKSVANRRLNGLVSSPPIVTGRGMIVVTDRGQIEVYDVASGANARPLSVLAAREANSAEPLMRYPIVTGRTIWIADTQLTKYSIVPTGDQLPVEEIEDNFAGAAFDHPLIIFGDTLVHVRRPKHRAGFVVAASDIKSGHPLWETDLAMPLAGPPVVDDPGKSLAVANAEGYIFRFNEAAIRQRVQDEPVAGEMVPADLPPLVTATELGQGRAIFSAPGATRLLLYNPAQTASARWLPLDSPLTCPVTPLGQGFITPLKIGQVFYLSSSDGTRLAVPFQPRLDPQTALDFKPAAAIGSDGRQFVITDGLQKIYLVALADKPQPHLEEVKHADVGPHPVSSPLVALGDNVLAVAGGTHLLRFHLPTLETAGEINLQAPAEWGPFRAGDLVLLATADHKLVAISAAGEMKWQAATNHGPLAGPPLLLPDGVLLTYRKGIIERRSIADGKPLATVNIEQPLATAPVVFLQHLVVATADGTLLVVDKP